MTQPPPYPEMRPDGPVAAPPPETSQGPAPAGYEIPSQPVPGYVRAPRPAAYPPPAPGGGYGPPGGGYGPPGGGQFPPPPGWPGYGPPFAPPPPALSPSGAPLAGFGDRILAYLIDGAIAVGVAMVLAVPVFIIFFATVGTDLFTVRSDGTLAEPDPMSIFVPLLLIEAGLMLVMLVLHYVYYVELMFRTGQTVGKRVMKIKTVPLDPAVPLDRGIAAKRFLVQFVGAMFLPGFGYLDGLWQLWDKPHQQCLHDKFARTVVVKVLG